MLEKLDRLRLFSIFAGDRLKKFDFWQRFYLNYILNLDYKELPNLKDFFSSNGNSNFFDVPNNIFDL